jgi:choline dehydrogenase-like flavoprotein
MPEKKEYDVLIVGSGAAGGMAAHTLTQRGASCLMLEAGPLPEFDKKTAMRPVYDLPFRGLGDPKRLKHVVQRTEFNANRWVRETDLPYTYDPKEQFNWVRVRMVGGRSLFWARMSFRLSNYEFKAADYDGFGDNWPISYEDLAPYYDRVEEIFRVSGLKEGLEQLPDGNFVADNSPYSGSIQRIRDAASAKGIPSTKIRRAIGDGRLASSFNLTLPGALATGKLDIVENAIAREVTVDKATGLVNGVNYVDRRSGREIHAKAKRVVLAASSLETTRLLLNSGIANSSGVLGHYLIDQFYVRGGVNAIAPEARGGKAPRGFMGGSGYLPRFRNLRGQRQQQDFIRGYAVDFSSGRSIEPRYFPSYGAQLTRDMEEAQGAGLRFTTMGAVLPRYENHMRIDGHVVDAWGIPVPRISLKYSDNEFNMAREAMDTLTQLCDDAGFSVLAAHDEMHPPGHSIHNRTTSRISSLSTAPASSRRAAKIQHSRS